MEANYREETTDKVLDKYRDLVDKIFTVIDMDKLDAEIKNAEDDEEGEARLLTKVNNRKKALDRIEDCLERIGRLEKLQNQDNEEPGNTKESLHPTKRFAKR